MQHLLPSAENPAYATAVYVPDTLRNPQHQPGRLVYSAQFDKDKLNCLHTALYFPFFCALDGISNQTSLDVYTNGVLLTRPDTCGMDCCLPIRHPIGTFRHFDHGAFDLPATNSRLLGCNLLFCMGFLGMFGEQMNLTSRFLNACKPSCIGHIGANCCYVCANESVYGLQPGESARLAGIINEQVRLFRANPSNYGLDPVAQGAGASYVKKAVCGNAIGLIVRSVGKL